MLRENYPKPNYVRPRFKSLDGEWSFFAFSQERESLEESISRNVPDSNYDDSNVDYVAYKKTFILSEADSVGSVFLNFGSISGDIEIIVNDESAGKRKGAPGNLVFDISNHVIPGQNFLSVIVTRDPLFSSQQYSPPYISGRVWLEYSAKTYLERLVIRPSLSDKSIYLSGRIINSSPGCQIYTEVSLDSQVVANFNYDAKNSLNIRIPLPEPVSYWDVSNPNIYEIKITLVNSLGGICDCIHTYTALRNIEIKNNSLFINNKVVYLKLIKDNEGISSKLNTPARVRQFFASVLTLGFNGVDLVGYEPSSQFIYLADKLGIALLFSLVPEGIFPLSEDASKLIQAITTSRLLRHIASPSIIIWSLFVKFDPGAEFVRYMFSLCKKIHPSMTISSYVEEQGNYGDLSLPSLVFSDKSLFLKSLSSYIDSCSPTLISFSSNSFIGAYSPLEIPEYITEKQFLEAYSFMTGAILAGNSLGYSYDYLIDTPLNYGGLYSDNFGNKLSRNAVLEIKQANSRRSISELNEIIQK